MKVLQIYAGNLFGGIERLLTSLARQADANSSIGRHFALCFPGRLMTELNASSSHVYDLGHARLSRPWTVFRARHRLRKLIREEKFDTVICHSYWPMALFGGVVRSEGVPLIFWAHDAPDGRQWIETLARRVRPDRVIANSHFTAGRVASMYPGVPCDVRYHPLAAPEPVDRAQVRAQVRREIGTDEKTCVIILASRLEPWKGHRLLLRALSRLREMSGWECWIAGGVQRQKEQRYMDELIEMAQAGGIESRIRFLGQRQDIDQLLCGADIHCQPNEGPEPFGVTFIEALYAGLPVITTRMGGGAEIVDSTCGVLVEPGDVEALAGELQKMISDPVRRGELGRCAPARAAQICDPVRNLAEIDQTLRLARAGSDRR